jgi:hypothetical protein
MSPDSEWLSGRKQIATNAAKDDGERRRNPYYTFGENLNYSSHYESQYGDSSKN